MYTRHLKPKLTTCCSFMETIIMSLTDTCYEVRGTTVRWGLCHRRSVCLSGTGVYCGQTAWTIDRADFRYTVQTHGNSNHVLGGDPNPFRGVSSLQSFQPPKCGPRSPKLAKNMFEDWGAISRKRCMIRNWCQQMTYRKPPKLYALSTGEVTFDTGWPWKVKDRFGLLRSAISA